MKNQRNKAMTMVILLIIITIALVDNTKGIFVPAFKESFNANNTKITFVLTAASLGYIIATYVGGLLCEKLGQRKVISIGLIIMIVSLLLIGVSKVYVLLLIGMFFNNVGIGFVMIGINTMIPLVFITCQALMMNIVHCSYGFGSAIGQFSIGRILSTGIEWRYIFIGIAVIFLVILAATYIVKIPNANTRKEISEKLNTGTVFKEKYMYFYAIALGTYVFGEMGLSNWLVNFLIDGYKAEASTGATILAAFSFFLTIGRLLGGFVAEKFGYFQSVITSLIISVVILFASLIIGSKALIFISVAGLFFSIVYPTVVATISQVFKENSSYITGVILTLSSTVNMILNLVIGRLSDTIGTVKAFYLIPVSLIISIVFLVIIFIGKHRDLLGGKYQGE